MPKKLVGHILSGSLSEGLVMRISSESNVSDIKTGRFVSIETPQGQFFSLITDLRLEVTRQEILASPPAAHEHLLQRFLHVQDVYAIAVLRPLLMLSATRLPKPVKTIPPHFSPVFEADRADVAAIFGEEDGARPQHFAVGTPLGMEEASVCINLDRLTERSTGIFGKTGTGKTFLTRLLLAGLIHRNKAVTVIFDMHSEYGLQARKESSDHTFVKGLKTLFSGSVALFSLDPVSTRRRGSTPDVIITLDYQAVAVEDVISLQEELNLHPTACEAAHLIAAKYKHDWLAVLLRQGDRLKDFAQEIGAHPESIAALYRKLRHIERLAFFQPEAAPRVPIFEHMLDYIDKGISIVIEFGNFTSTFCYLLIANIITRKLHALYVQKTEKFLGSHLSSDEPKKLLIVIEEAHKFLNPLAARQTIFGTIAREMRKYYVSLLIVDQRPSGIDSEIVSQLGTKIIAQLSDERDLQAVLSGVHNAPELRTILATLESKRQVLLLGHAIAMPIVVEARAYDEVFYQSLLPPENRDFKKFINELF